MNAKLHWKVNTRTRTATWGIYDGTFSDKNPSTKLLVGRQKLASQHTTAPPPLINRQQLLVDDFNWFTFGRSP